VTSLSTSDRSLPKDDPTKMASWPLLDGPDGVPIVAGCDWFIGNVLDRFDLGDHTGFLLEPVAGHLQRDGDGQLGHHGASDIAAGRPAGVPEEDQGAPGMSRDPR
jgi:flavin reductase (DIM6/NTAB) family NADH-FMN oxidoreductase RutF